MSETSTIAPDGPVIRRAAAGGVCGRSQLARLLRLVLILQAERFPNARAMAERCEVSRRTIYRDLDVLVEAGIPVRYRQDRQGYQLAKGFFLPPTSLDESEALALFVMARQGMGGDGLGLLRHARAGADKLVQGLPSEVRDRVMTAVEPFRDGTRAEGFGGERGAVHDAILGSLSTLRQVRLWYREPGSTAEECTKFSLYRLVWHHTHWFLIGRSSSERRVRVIGLPWVRKVALTDDGYTVPPRFDLARFLGQAWGVRRDRSRFRVWLRFGPGVVPELCDAPRHRGMRREDLDDGGVDLHLGVDDLEEILSWVLGFGGGVEVLAPDELRGALFRVSAGVARRYRPARRGSRSVGG